MYGHYSLRTLTPIALHVVRSHSSGNGLWRAGYGATARLYVGAMVRIRVRARGLGLELGPV